MSSKTEAPVLEWVDSATGTRASFGDWVFKLKWKRFWQWTWEVCFRGQVLAYGIGFQHRFETKLAAEQWLRDQGKAILDALGEGE